MLWWLRAFRAVPRGFACRPQRRACGTFSLPSMPQTSSAECRLSPTPAAQSGAATPTPPSAPTSVPALSSASVPAPSSVLAFALAPAGGGGERLAALCERWPAARCGLCERALPVLLSPNPADPDAVASACRALCDALALVDEAVRATGLRVGEAFPAALAVALWQSLPPHASVARRAKGKTLREFRAACRALALRTRELGSELAPNTLVPVLLAMEHCGALSDDIIGPTVTELLRRHRPTPPQHVATNHLLSTRLSAVDGLSGLFDAEMATAFARLLGRLRVPSHFQLHRFVHTVLLPAMGAAKSSPSLDKDALLDLTACYTRYAVSGTPAAQLTALWMPHVPQLGLDYCSAVIGVIGAKGAAQGAEEDYLPLVEAVLVQAATLCMADQSPDAASIASFMCGMAKVNAVGWIAAYITVATALDQRHCELPITVVARVASALMQRDSHLPFHPLHENLARRLITSDDVMKDVRIANTAMLSLALMVPPRNSNEASVLNASSDAIAVDTLSGRALAVFRRHGTRLGIRGFVAGMCSTPLAQLPPRARERVVVHFSSVASAVEVQWLVRGITALTTQIPTSVDAVSVQRWFSRFTAVDVSRKLDVGDATALLHVLSNENYSRDCALAKREIVSQVGRLLLRADVPFESLAPLSTALQRANVFFPHLYSRLCRTLLSSVETSPWKVILPVFHTIADEFTRRPHGSVFRDVWEGLRGRIMSDAAATLDAVDIVFALNGFAALDGRDRPLFSVLIHRLWVLYGELEAVEKSPALWADGVLLQCTPSALSVLAATLIHTSGSEATETFTPWVLLRLHPLVSNLYPIDVLHLIPSLLHCFATASVADAEASVTSSWLRAPMHRSMLHATYDACRELFLCMYEDEATSQDVEALQAKRKEWTAQVRMSLSRVPRGLFVELLVELCRSGLQDEMVATAAAGQVTRHTCGTIPIGSLVDLTMSMCFHFPPPTDHCEADNEEMVEHKTPHRRFMPLVLNALWYRVEELQAMQVDAVIRCLQHYYREKVDQDFIERLAKHKESLPTSEKQQRKRNHDGDEENLVNSRESSPVVSEVKEKFSVNLVREILPDDLFTD